VISLFLFLVLATSEPAHRHQEPLPPKPSATCGELPRSATWKKKDIWLNRSLHVPKGMVLWIDRDVTVHIGARDSCRSDNAPISIVVEGRLVVSGNAWQPVTIGADGFASWQGIRVLGSARIDYARIRGAERGLWFHGGTGTVQATLVQACNIGVEASGGATPQLSHLVFNGCRVAGLHSSLASPEVSGCLFLDNRGLGAWFQGTGLAKFSRNAFWHNLQGNVLGSATWGNFRGKGSVKSDSYGNLLCDPILVGTAKDNAWKDSLRRAERRIPDAPFGFPPWSLSWLSPLRGKGPICLRKPWKRTDIGLYGLEVD
jgi:hypothetical protein